MLLKVRSAALFGAALSLAGQGVTLAFSRQTWHQGSLVDLWGSPREGCVAAVTAPTGKVVTRIPAPPASVGAEGRIHWTPDGFFWSAFDHRSKGEGDTSGGCHLWRWMPDVERWVWHGSWPEATGNVTVLSEDWSLACDSLQGFRGPDRKRYPFLRLKLHPRSRRLQVYEFMEAGLSKPFFQGGKVSPYAALARGLWFSWPVRDESFVVVPAQAGMYWIFSAVDGRFKRVMNLFQFKEEELQSTQMLDPHLGIQPRQDGGFLLATRTGAYAALAQIGSRRGDLPPMPEREEAMPAWREQKNLLVEAWAKEVNARAPHVEWYTLWPQEGRFMDEATPRGMPNQIHSMAETRAYKWRFQVDGTVVREARPAGVASGR